jgi:hypothetical protein
MGADGEESVDQRDGEVEYARLAHYAEVRTAELSEMLKPYVEVTDGYGRLLCRLTVMLGKGPQKDVQDIAVRDLMADVFDFLVESRRAILSGQLNVSYPPLRRAFESTSLLALCCLDPGYAGKWQAGLEIKNYEVRQQLAKHQMGESEKTLKDNYRFFSKSAHPNRELVASRSLGDGNEFVLGSIGHPDLLMTIHYCRHHLSIWFWFAAAICWHYRERSPQNAGGFAFASSYMSIANEAKNVGKQLVSEFNRLIDERDMEKSASQVKDS